jgi:hypothetical protein
MCGNGTESLRSVGFQDDPNIVNHTNDNPLVVKKVSAQKQDGVPFVDRVGVFLNCFDPGFVEHTLKTFARRKPPQKDSALLNDTCFNWHIYRLLAKKLLEVYDG